MTLRPVLAPTCGRCGKRREGLVHHCLSNSNRKATVSLKLDWGKCGKCRRRYTGNPLLHVCKPKSDFKRRKKKAEAKRKRQAEKHDYQACADQDCPRPLCVAYKTGDRAGYRRGFDDGFGAGFGSGFAAGQASSGAA